MEVEDFKARARLELRKLIRRGEYGELGGIRDALGLCNSQVAHLMYDTPSMSLERLLRTLDKAGIEYTLEFK